MSGTHGVFQHRTGYFYTILEEDFCEVYKAPGVNEVCRAYITSILEHLTNKQFEATGRDNDIWVFMSLPEMERRMRHACSQRTIHKELQSMVKEGFLFKRRAIGKATMEYKLNLRKLRKALEALPEVQSSNSARYNLANLQDQSSNSARLILQNDKINLANLQPRIHREEERDYTEITEESVLVATPSPNETYALGFTEDDYHFYGTKRQHLVWNCHNWCAAEHGTCEDYVAAIENGWQEAETGKQAAVKIGVTNDTPADSHSPAFSPGDAGGSSRALAHLQDRGLARRSEMELAAPARKDPVRAEQATQTAPAVPLTQGATDGNITAHPDHPRGDRAARDHRTPNLPVSDEQVAIASTPGEPDTSPLSAHTRQSQTSSSLSELDGATTGVEAGEPRASHGNVTQEKLRILDDWDKVQGQPVPRNRRHMEAALALVTAHPTREELAGCQKWLPETDNPTTLWYHKRGVGLWDVAEKLGLYRNHLALSIEPAPLADVKKTPTEAPVKRWNAAEHRKMLKEFEAREHRELEAKQQNLQA